MHDRHARPPPPSDMVKSKDFMRDQSGNIGLDIKSGAMQWRKTRAVWVGYIIIGDPNPVVV